MRYSVLALLLLGGVAAAQDKAVVVSTCGTPPSTYTAGQIKSRTINTNGEDCSNASGGGGGGAVTQSGTWTVQPGNTANTTPWKVDDDATQTSLGTIDGRVDSLEGLVGTTNTNTGTTATNTGTIATNTGTTATNTGTIAGRLPTSLGSAADAASLPVTQSTEDKAALAALATALATIITQLPPGGSNFLAPTVQTHFDKTFAAGGASQEVVPARTDRHNMQMQWEGTGTIYCSVSTSAATVAVSGHDFFLEHGDYWEPPLGPNGIAQQEINCIPSATAAGSLVGVEYRS